MKRIEPLDKVEKKENDSMMQVVEKKNAEEKALMGPEIY